MTSNNVDVSNKRVSDKTVRKVIDLIVLCLSEILGTALLLFFGCMGCVVDAHPIPNYISCPFNFGLAVALAVQTVVHISGAHLNPAVSIAACIMGKMKLYVVPLYIIAQLVGGIIGYGFIMALLPEEHTNGLCVPIPHDLVTDLQAMFLEVIGTTALVLLVCTVWDPRTHGYFDSLSLKLGLMIATIFISIGPFSGGGFNPARSLPPAIYQNIWTSQWVFVVGPLIASIIAPLMYRFTFLEGLSNVKKNSE